MNNKIPPPIVTLTFGLFIYFSKSFFPEFNNDLLGIASGLSLIIGIGVLISAVASFRKQKTTVNPLDIEKASSLVISGVFKYSRNPMYLGMVFILFSITLKFNLIGGIILTLLFALFITKFQIIPEEVVMKKLFKEGFDSYKKKTRRWL
tara:strand:- start:130 stop:576 length:447 start_codon:yes stop_codon:yes gene_type:complete